MKLFYFKYLTAFIIATVFLFFCYNTNAQTTDVVSGIQPTDLVINGDYLYFRSDYNTISKIDVTDEESEIIEVSTGLDNVWGLALNANELYISSLDLGKIVKIDITETSPTIIDIATGLNGPQDIETQGNYLYYAEYNTFGNGNGNGKISKIDITETSSMVEVVIDGLITPYSILINNNDLYFGHNVGDKLSKLDITESTPNVEDILTITDAFFGLALNGDDLYFSNFSGNKISKINITESTPTVTDVVTGLNGPAGLAIYGDYLYIGEIGANKISKFNLTTLSTKENTLEQNVNLFPNPSNNFIQLQGLQESIAYKIYSSIGQLINKGVISNEERIGIQKLSNGLYFLKLDNMSALKFVKE